MNMLMMDQKMDELSRDANEWADDTMYMATAIKMAPRRAYERMQRALEKAELLRSKAYCADGMRYDKKRVQPSNRYDLSDAVADIQEAEEAAHTAAMEYIGLVGGLRQVCIAAGFSEFQQKIWLQYYGGECRSIGLIAICNRTTKSCVQNLLTGRKAETNFALGIDALADGADCE